MLGRTHGPAERGWTSAPGSLAWITALPCELWDGRHAMSPLCLRALWQRHSEVSPRNHPHNIWPRGARNQQIVASLFSHFLQNLTATALCTAISNQTLVLFFSSSKGFECSGWPLLYPPVFGKRRHSSLAALFSLLVVQISLQTTNPLFCGWVL